MDKENKLKIIWEKIKLFFKHIFLHNKNKCKICKEEKGEEMSKLDYTRTHKKVIDTINSFGEDVASVTYANGKAKIEYKNGGSINLPIKAGTGIVIDADEAGTGLEIHSDNAGGGSMHRYYITVTTADYKASFIYYTDEDISTAMSPSMFVQNLFSSELNNKNIVVTCDNYDIGNLIISGGIYAVSKVGSDSKMVTAFNAVEF